jgi:hypothetical protein
MKLDPKLTALCCLVALACGCRPAEPGPGLVRRPSIRKDACGDRVHDICGPLLEYQAVHGKLPPTLADLPPGGDLPLPPLVCPVSGKAYVYNPKGLSVGNWPGHVVLYDPEPSHSGMRWAILVGTSSDGGSITARAILVSDREVTSAIARPKPAPPAGQ